MPDKLLDQIRTKLGHASLQYTPSLYLDTGIPDLNRVLGHADKGIPYGAIIEVSGLESVGKSALSLSLAALAQQDGALVVWGDFERSWSPDWSRTRGLAKCPACTTIINEKCHACGGVDSLFYRLDTSHLQVLQPYVGTFGERNEKGKIVPGKRPRLSTAEEITAEMEAVMTALHRKHDRMVIVVDSLASMLTQSEAAAGLEGANLRTAQSHPVFLGHLLRRWVGLSQSYNALIILINQLRQNPMARFGDSWYTPGGNAPRFYSHVRVRVKRVKGSRIIDTSKGGKGMQIGTQGIVQCKKNKVGGIEGSECGYKLMFHGPLEFFPVKPSEESE
jgi:RecA/RadA recombinase